MLAIKTPPDFLECGGFAAAFDTSPPRTGDRDNLDRTVPRSQL
jgi:hypothetical protein